MRLYGLEEAIRRFAGPVLGTCAGMILLDRAHLGLVDLEVERNAYGRQLASFEADLELAGDEEPLHGVFIRAPRVAEIGPRRGGAGRARRRAGAAPRRPVPRRLVPSGADGRHARPRAVPRARPGGGRVSGHSKWSSIKHKKGAADAKRGQLFTKLSRAIIVAAKEGGPDPAANLSLQNAIEKARSYSMPKDNIERAIAKGSGADADAAAFETVVYEGYGPDGVAVLVEALTDNRNRTASDVRHTFAKNGGNLGTTGRGRVALRAARRRARRRGDGRRGRADARGGRRRRGRRRAGRLGLPGHVRPGAGSRRSARRSRRPGSPIESAELSMVPKTTVEVAAEASREEAGPPDRGARGERRRPGRLRELRHPRAGAGGRHKLGRRNVRRAA